MWTTVIALGINLVAIVLLVPETRFERDYGENIPVLRVGAESAHPSTIDDEETKHKETMMETKDLELFPTRNTVPVNQRSYLRSLSPWSGIKKNDNLFLIFCRPFPMLAYPAVILGILGCEFLSSDDVK